MMMEKFFSAGEAARMLGVSRDTIQNAIRGGAPDSSLRVAGKRAFTQEDVNALRRWFQAHSRRQREVSIA
jgi:DNA-directed RNA polymerase specialized sigma24 family protein